MSKKIIVGSIIGIGIILVLAVASSGSPKSSEAISNSQDKMSGQTNLAADKVQVFLFHAAKRCATCLSIGRLSGKTVDEFFQPELKDGKIEFREINIDLPENKELARKFQASGSSLFINAIYDGKDYIKEDVAVWRLTQNEAQFKSYLKNKINGLFGK